MANLENQQGENLSSEEMRNGLMQRLARNPRLQAAILALMMTIGSGAIVQEEASAQEEASTMSLNSDTKMLEFDGTKTIVVPLRGRTFTVSCHQACSPTLSATEGLDITQSLLGPNSFSFTIKFKRDAKGPQSVTIDLDGKTTTLKVIKAQPGEPLVRKTEFEDLKKRFETLEEKFQKVCDEAKRTAEEEAGNILEAAQYYLTAPQLKNLEEAVAMVKNSLQAANNALSQLADEIEDKNLLKATQESLSSAIKALNNLQTIVDELKKDERHQLTPERRQALLNAAQESLSSATKALGNLQTAVNALEKDKKYQLMNPELRQALLKAAQENLNSAATAFEALIITIQRIGGYVPSPRVWDDEKKMEQQGEDIKDTKKRVTAVENKLAADPVNEFNITAGVVGAKGQTGFEADLQYGRTIVKAGKADLFKLNVKGGLGIERLPLPIKGFPGETTLSEDYFAIAGLEEEIQAVRNWFSIVFNQEIEIGLQNRKDSEFPNASLKAGHDGFVGGAFTGELQTGFGTKNFRFGLGGGAEISNKREEVLGSRGDPAVRWRVKALLGGKF